MTRYKQTPEGVFPFTPEEEAEWDRLEAEWAAEAPKRLLEDVTQATQEHMDNFARTRNYDNMLSACTYAVSQIPKFKTEGTYCLIMRDTIWTKLYEMLEEVQNGIRPLPESFQDILPELPELKWPDEY